MKIKPIKLVILNNPNLRFLLDIKLNTCNIKIQYKGDDPSDPRVINMLEKEITLDLDTDIEKELEIMYLDYLEKSKIGQYFTGQMKDMTKIEFLIDEKDEEIDNENNEDYS